MITADEPLTGKYRLVSAGEAIGGIRPLRAVGSFDFEKGTARITAPTDGGGLLALVPYTGKAEELREFLRGRKKEIVFPTPSYTETATGLILTPLMSATAPALAPMGYFSTGDYAGMGMWAVNSAPWFYLQYDGYRHGLRSMDRDRRDASADMVATHYFSWYMFCAGNMPFFADAAASSRLKSAGMYEGKEQYLGNSATAVMLSLAGGGGGMFYRGKREWGCFYFQANNILMYLTLRSVFRSRNRDHSGITSSDVKHGDKSVIFLSSYAALKLVEMVHTALSDDSIDAGDEVSGSCAFMPAFDQSGGDSAFSLAARYAF
jgi:hypothetical protein